MALAEEYLERIRNYLRDQSSAESFRTLLDSWFAHDRGSELWLTRNGRGYPRWFNKPRIKADWARNEGWEVTRSLYAMDFMSEGAHEIVQRKRNGEPFEMPRDWIVKDHCVPLRELKIFFRNQVEAFDDINALRDSLRRYYKIGAITKKEDCVLLVRNFKLQCLR